MVAVDLTWVKVNGGRASMPTSAWDEDHDPVEGQAALLSDDGPFRRALIEAADASQITFSVPAYACTVAPGNG